MRRRPSESIAVPAFDVMSATGILRVTVPESTFTTYTNPACGLSREPLAYPKIRLLVSGVQVSKVRNTCLLIWRRLSECFAPVGRSVISTIEEPLLVVASVRPFGDTPQ